MKNTPKITAVLVEDSRLARLELKEILKNYPQIEIIGEAENTNKAYQLIKKVNPTLLFLDINMPEKNGFELLEMLDKIPIVIFTTAYDEYAIKSFEYNAFDYLLKPINPKRFKKTLTENSQLFIKEGENCWMITLKEIALFEVMGNYTRTYFKNNKPLIYKSLNQISEKLPKTFFRVNRQQIINLNEINKVDSWFNGKLKITLKNGISVETSRRQALKFRQELEF